MLKECLNKLHNNIYAMPSQIKCLTNLVVILLSLHILTARV